MKKICQIACLLLLITGKFLPAYAQQQKGDKTISVGIGFGSSEMMNDAMDDFGRSIVVIGSWGTYNAGIINRTYSPTFHLSFGNAFTDKITANFIGTYEKATGDYTQNNEIVGNFRRQSFTLATAAKFLYLNRKIISLYGEAGFGFTYNHQKTTKPADWKEIFPANSHFNFQISPIGIRIGNQIGGFLEAGYGYKGMLNCGVNYRF